MKLLFPLIIVFFFFRVAQSSLKKDVEIQFKPETTLTLDAQDAIIQFVSRHCLEFVVLKEDLTMTDIHYGEKDVVNRFSSTQLSGSISTNLMIKKSQLMIYTADYTGDGPSIVVVSLLDMNPEGVCR